MARFCVLGSGITGLSVAYYLKKHNPTAGVIILEEKSVSGGVIESGSFGDCVVEWGPRGIRTKGNGQLVLEMVEDLGLWDDIIFADDKAKKRYLYHDNKLQVLPHSFFSFIRSPYLVLFVKAMFKDLSAKKVEEDETIAEFTDRHFGEEFRDLFFDSMVSGIWAGDVSKMSISATLPLLKKLESKKGSILKALFTYKSSPKSTKTYPKEVTSKALFSFKNGVQVLVNKLKEVLGDSIVYNSKIVSIDHQNSTLVCVDGNSYSYDTLISTIPAYKLSAFVSKEMAADLNSINYSPVGILNIKFDKAQLNFDGFGFLVPSREKSVVLGMVANSNTFPMHGSKISHVNTIMLGGARYTYDQLRAMDLKQESAVFLEKVFGLRLKIEQQDLRLLENAIPQYEIGHLDKVLRISNAAPSNLIVLGNFMYGVSIIDIISKSKYCAESIN
jgi:oxygen-dependent protoporphyrinogen oxidase